MVKYNIRTGIKKIKTKTTLAISGAALGITGLAMAIALPLGAKAASTVVVTPANQQGWSTMDTRPGGNVTFVNDVSSPAPNGALKLTTDATTTSKAQYLHSATASIADVTELSYYTKQNAAIFPGGDPSYQFIVDLNGAATGGFTTFVYEPYENGVVVPGTWQLWDVDAGQMWSSRSFSEGTCTVVAGAGGAPFYTLAQIQSSCPSATVLGFGVNIGSNNPGYDVETDLVSFNGTTYNFEQTAPAVTLTNKDDCKNGGWMTSNNPTFKNQGDCVSFFATKGKNGGGASYNHFTYGSVTLSSPTQQLNFAGQDNGLSSADTGTFTYTNTSPAFGYTAQLTCVNIVGNTAYMTYQIPATSPVAAGTWVIWKVVDNGASDVAGFTTAPDMSSANALCESASAVPTNYAITAGDILVQ